MNFPTEESVLNKILDGMADFESRISWMEMLHSPSNADRDPISELTIEASQNRTDIIYTAEQSVEMYQEVADKCERLFNVVASHINRHTKKKDTSNSYIYSSIKEDNSDEKLHSD